MNRIKELPEKYKKIYKDFYKDYALSRTFMRKIISFFESWYHKEISNMGNENETILEIGCGSLNHINYEKKFLSYEVVEPKEFLINQAERKKKIIISKTYTSLDCIPSNKNYSKIISIAVLEHVNNLEEHILKIIDLLHPNGIFAVAIPAEGEFLWWLAWRLTSGISFWLKYRLDYGIIMRYEHINNSTDILKKLRKYFFIYKLNSFPLNIKNFRIYITLECKLNKRNF
tara:strand:+ start:32007 stop:32693 length:687 start_codon:yes stop_codon:yes gene_type:complete